MAVASNTALPAREKAVAKPFELDARKILEQLILALRSAGSIPVKVNVKVFAFRSKV